MNYQERSMKIDSNKTNFLLVDDEESFLKSMSTRLEVRNFNVIAVNRGEKKEHKWMEVVILTGHGSVDSAVECTKSGAYLYLQKPCELEQLLDVLKDVYKKRVMNRKDY